MLLGQIDEAITQENSEVKTGQPFTPAELMNIAAELNEALSKEPKPQTKEEKQKRRQQQKQVRQLEEHAAKLGEYDERLEIMGERNSFSKTDRSAMFVRMKEDVMNNG